MTVPIAGVFVGMELPNRKLQRLTGYDYSQNGYYFVTICTHNKNHILGMVQNNNVYLSDYGKIASIEFENIKNHFDCIKVEKYIIMPNYIHCILVINTNEERSRPFPTLSTVVGLFKSGVSKRIHQIDSSLKVWQKSFYDCIIKNEKSYMECWKYIDQNALTWESDECY